MSSAIIYANQPKVFSLWDDHKNVLRELYLTKKMNLKDVKKVMESDYGFPTTFTVSTYETTLRDHLGFRKNLKRSDWEAVAAHLEKRQGKESDVIFRGDRLDHKRVAKEVDRYRLKTSHPIRVPTPPLPASIIISTPPPAPVAVPYAQPSEHAATISPMRDIARRGRSPSAVHQAADITQDFNTNLGTSSMLETRLHPDNVPSYLQSEVGYLLEGRFLQARINLPINGFIAKLLALVSFLDENDKDMLQSLAYLHQMTGSPTTFGWNTSVAVLAHASFMLSNRNYYWDQAKSFYQWIEKVVDIQLLGRFFSQNTPTTIAAWPNLVPMAGTPYPSISYDTMAEIWFEAGLIATDDKFIQDYSTLCYRILGEMSPARAWAVFKRLLQARKMFGHQRQEFASEVLLQPLNFFKTIRDPVLTKDLIDSRVFLPKKVHYYSWAWELEGSSSELEGIKMLVEAGVSFDCGPRDDENHLIFHFPKPRGRSLDNAWLTRLDNLAEFVGLSSGPLKEFVSVAGICASANKGRESLCGYLRGKQGMICPITEVALQYALSKSSRYGLLNIVEVLLQHGVDVEVPKAERRAKKPSTGFYDTHLRRPIIEAVMAADVDMIRLLVKHGACLDRQDVSDALIRPAWERSEGAVSCESLLGLLSGLGLCFKRYGPTTMLKAVGILEHKHRYISFPYKFVDGCLIKTLQKHGVLWDTTILNACEFWQGASWGSIDGETDLFHAAIRMNCGISNFRWLLDEEGVHMHWRPCELDHRSILHAALRTPNRDRTELVLMLLDRMPANKEADPIWPRVLGLSMNGIRELSARSTLELWRHCLHWQSVHDEKSCLPLFNALQGLGAVVPDPTDRVRARERFFLMSDLIAAEAQEETIVDVWGDGKGFEKLCEEDQILILRDTIKTYSMRWACTLVDYGVNVNGTVAGCWGTAFQDAVPRGYPLWFIRYLLQHGGDTTFDSNTGFTALHHVANEGNLNLATLLLEYVDVNATWAPITLDKDSLGFYPFREFLPDYPLSTVHTWRQSNFTPLDVATAAGRLDMVKFLLNIGGRSAVPGKSGFDGALKIARINTHHGVVVLLKEELAARAG
ncbi:uncharacterized protein PG998_014852 [Apiospora kogelbergensis]|uniref:uncharacterized protein n=1 Tax=Apiospora kogelbergensis TaxID=1337665 RepID=UPI003130C9B8